MMNREDAVKIFKDVRSLSHLDLNNPIFDAEASAVKDPVQQGYLLALIEIFGLTEDDFSIHPATDELPDYVWPHAINFSEVEISIPQIPNNCFFICKRFVWMKTGEDKAERMPKDWVVLPGVERETVYFDKDELVIPLDQKKIDGGLSKFISPMEIYRLSVWMGNELANPYFSKGIIQEIERKDPYAKSELSFILDHIKSVVNSRVQQSEDPAGEDDLSNPSEDELPMTFDNF